MKQRNRLGLSLIELIVVITIIGVLLATAVPSYQLYLLRTKSATVLKLLHSYKSEIIEGFAIYNRFPALVGPVTSPDYIDFAAGQNGGTESTQQIHWNNPGSNTIAWLFIQVSEELGSGWPALLFYNQNGKVVTWCGFWDAAGWAGSSPQYFPSSCNRTDLGSIAANPAAYL